MNIRDADKADAQMCGRILYDAFTNLATQHNFPPDFPSAEAATGLASMLIGAPGFYGVVAEEAGKIVGSNFMDERSPIVGVRLVQAGYHNRSLCLYTKLGFVTREPLSLLQGPKLNARFSGYEVRPAA